MNLSDYLNYPKKAVVGLVNNDLKQVYLVYTDDSLIFLCQHLRLLREQKHPCLALHQQALEFIIFEHYDDFQGHWLGKHCWGLWSQKLSQEGWTLLNNIKAPKLCGKVLLDTDKPRHLLASVFVVDERYNKVKIETFKRLAEAEAFLQSHSLESLLRIGLARKG